MKEGLDRVEDVLLRNVPVFMVEESRYPIRSKSFMRTQLEDCPFNFIIYYRHVKGSLLMLVNFRDRKSF